MAATGGTRLSSPAQGEERAAPGRLFLLLLGQAVLLLVQPDDE
jgi:hypothetical protein